jgi:3-methyl-2-oxobutanoate hydroxymethyltransferase
VRNARLLQEAGADCVKLEGGTAMLPQIRAIIDDGIALVGHIGMLPQSVREEGGYRKKGKSGEEAARLHDDARALDEAGALAIVLEGIVPSVADSITAATRCPTIGIGSGPACDGEVLVTADVIGSFPWFRPPFAQARADVAGELSAAARAYIASVKGGR